MYVCKYSGRPGERSNLAAWMKVSSFPLDLPVICILVTASQEYVNIYSTCRGRVGRASLDPLESRPPFCGGILNSVYSIYMYVCMYVNIRVDPANGFHLASWMEMSSFSFLLA